MERFPTSERHSKFGTRPHWWLGAALAAKPVLIEDKHTTLHLEPPYALLISYYVKRNLKIGSQCFWQYKNFALCAKVSPLGALEHGGRAEAAHIHDETDV